MDILRKEWNITYSVHDKEGGLDEHFVVLPSFLKVLWCLITRGRNACCIYIWTSVRVVKALTLEDCDEAMW